MDTHTQKQADRTMAKTTYTATHRGFSFTRKTLRTYTHAVLVPVSKAKRRDDAKQAARRNWNVNLAYQQAVAAGDHPQAKRFPANYPPERLAADALEAQAWIAKGEAGHVAETLARFDRRAADWDLDTDGDTIWTLSGFCGREDLARKLAAKDLGAVVVPAVAP